MQYIIPAGYLEFFPYPYKVTVRNYVNVQTRYEEVIEDYFFVTLQGATWFYIDSLFRHGNDRVVEFYAIDKFGKYVFTQPSYKGAS